MFLKYLVHIENGFVRKVWCHLNHRHCVWFSMVFYPLVFLRIIGYSTLPFFVFKLCRLNYHYDFIFKKVLYVLSLLHIVSKHTSTGKERECGSTNSSLFICLVIVRKSWSMNQGYRVSDRNHPLRLFNTSAISFHSFILLLLLEMASSNGLFHCLIILQHDKFKWFRAHCAN